MQCGQAVPMSSGAGTPNDDDRFSTEGDKAELSDPSRFVHKLNQKMLPDKQDS